MTTETLKLSAEKVLAIKSAATAAADSAKAVADKGTKLPVAQWAKRDQYETEGTAMLAEMLTAGAVVVGMGKPSVNKAGEVTGLTFKVGLPQCTLEEKVTQYVTTMENARARRKAAREAKKAGQAAPATATAAAKTTATTKAATGLADLVARAKARKAA